MNREQIVKLSNKNIEYSDLNKAKIILNQNYIISYGEYSPEELRKAIKKENPVIIKDNLIIGFDPSNETFFTKNKDIKIDKMVKAIIIEDEKEEIIEKSGDFFAIIGKNEWDHDINDFKNIFSQLRVGEIFLPPHSAVFNFLNQTDKQKKDKIVSMLDGININVYSVDNYVDNCIHEIGHLFWRDCLIFEEKKAFKILFSRLRPSALYEYDWEKSTAEEVFCTIYKWYLKSLLINKSFYNILEFEESEGLDLLQQVFDRIAKDKLVSDIWKMNKNSIFDYLNPRFDVTTGKFLRKKETTDIIKDIEIPISEMMNVIEYKDGIEFIQLGKAKTAINNHHIDLETKLVKAVDNDKKLFFDIDGVVANFVKGYKEMFQRDAYVDDQFTVSQFCCTMPNFFRYLEVLPKGQELYNALKNKYKIVFITTPMEGMIECKRDKIEWVKENFPGHDVIFSSSKADYVEDEKSVLIDDMEKNLNPWEDAGGTAINFNKPNDKIIKIIDNIFDDQKQIEKVKKQLKEMEVDETPTESQKLSGNYKKGDIVIKGIKIKVENPKGSIRWGINFNGQKWIQKMKAHYGYITGYGDAEDGDKIDVFIGDKLNASKCFIVNQIGPESGLFDEHKVILCVDNIKEAEDLYMSNYRPEWKGMGSIVQLNTKKLREWLSEGKFTEPYN